LTERFRWEPARFLRLAAFFDLRPAGLAIKHTGCVAWRTSSEWLPGFARDDRVELLNAMLRELRVAPAAPPERQAWDEILRGPFALGLDEIESEVSAAHRRYRERCPSYPDVVAEQLVHGLGIPLLFDRTAEASAYNPVTGLITIVPRASKHRLFFETVHETAECLCSKRPESTHADVQLVACGLSLERSRAGFLLARHGLAGALSRARRTHRRAPPWMLAVRLSMVLMSAPEA
jgi:hypothetical protein